MVFPWEDFRPVKLETICCRSIKLSELSENAKLKVPRVLACVPSYVYVINPQMIGYQVNSHSRCGCNQLVALVNRHLIDRSYIQFDNDYYQVKAKSVTKDLKFECERTTYNHIINQYSGSKKRLYQTAARQLCQEGLKKTDRLIKMFVKQDKDEVEALRTKPPRAIQYRNAKYTLALATYLKPLEKEFYTRAGKGPSELPVITKGLNGKEIAELFLEKNQWFTDPVYVQCDHSKFDSTIRQEHLKTEHNVYNRHYRDTSLKLMLRDQLVNIGYTTTGISYRIKGTRMSGDYNTGLGNSLINLIVLESWVMEVKHEIMLDGDDAVIIMERESLNSLDYTHFERMGFETKINFTSNIHEVEYCKRKLVGENPVFVRDPIRALSHMSITDRNMHPLHYKRYISGIFDCERLSNMGVPIFRNLPQMNLKPFTDTEYHRKMQPIEAVNVTVQQLSIAWNIDEFVVHQLDKGVGQYLGWDNTEVLGFINSRPSRDYASRTIFEKHQENISSRYASLCTTISECRSQISATNIQSNANEEFKSIPTTETYNIYTTLTKYRAEYISPVACSSIWIPGLGDWKRKGY